MSENIVKYASLLKLNNSFSKWKSSEKKRKSRDAINLIKKFQPIYNLELNKLPYRLNLMDELRSNENAHSKILSKLLMYRPALYDFLKFLNSNKSSNFNLNHELIKTPIITAERMRIDVLIKEKNKYAIIIENKIHNAYDQPRQIANYIDKCRDLGFPCDKIYVIYLTRTRQEVPSQQTWGDYDKEAFTGRYCHISYKEDVLKWLNEYKQNINTSEINLNAAITQYIDHLDHQFFGLKNRNQMDKNLQEFLYNELELSADNSENLTIIKDKINSINELNIQFTELSKIIKENLFIEWRNKLTDKFGTDSILFKKDTEFIKTGIILNNEGKKFSVLIEDDNQSVYIGIGRHYASDFLDSEIKTLFAELNVSTSMRPEEPWWYGWKYTEYNEGYICLIDLIESVKEILAKKQMSF